MTRNVLPIDGRQSQIAKADTAGNSRTPVAIGMLLVLLHIISVALALTCF